jgi:hypothetical protein
LPKLSAPGLKVYEESEGMDQADVLQSIAIQRKKTVIANLFGSLIFGSKILWQFLFHPLSFVFCAHPI